MNFLPHNGTYFDDLREDDERNEAREARRDPRKIADPTSISIAEEINRRPGVTAFVGSSHDRTELWKVFELWRIRGSIGLVPLVLVDTTQKPGTLRMRMV
jgi:hypothetical protein